MTTSDVPGAPTRESEIEATPTLTPDMEATVIAERAELLRAFKAKGKAQRIKIIDEMVAKAANPGKWNERSMVTWWKRSRVRFAEVPGKWIFGVGSGSTINSVSAHTSASMRSGEVSR